MATDEIVHFLHCVLLKILEKLCADAPANSPQLIFHPLTIGIHQCILILLAGNLSTMLPIPSSNRSVSLL
jgi:hypothetical protein